MAAPLPDTRADDGRPEQPELFISYAAADRARAETLYQRLRAEGLETWFDQEALRHGDDWHRAITARSDAARLVLPLITPAWNASQWTKYETYGARAVLPLVCEGGPADVLPPPLRHLHAPPFDPLTATHADWDRLLARIRDTLAQPVPEPPPPAPLELPHERNRWFTGREAEMNALHEALHPGPAANPDLLACAIAGLGGLGKTSLANEYARRFARLYRTVLWLDGDRDYALQFAARYAAVIGAPPPAGMPEAKQVAAALRQDTLRLLVLDNVTDAAAADPWLPRHGGCRTLITSRLRAFPPAVRTVDLDRLKPAASRGFLLARTADTPGDRDTAACDALPSGSVPFLQAALMAINDPAQAPALDRFPIWRDTPALPSDAPWPVPPG